MTASSDIAADSTQHDAVLNNHNSNGHHTPADTVASGTVLPPVKKQKLQHNNTATQQCNATIHFTSHYNEATNTHDTIISNLYATYPLKLFPLTAKNLHGAYSDTLTVKPALCYMITYGGGILAGDHIHINATIDTHCTAVLTTQTSTKVYKTLHSTQYAAQSLHVTVASNATLYLIPDPVTPYKKSNYVQKQAFHLGDNTSNLLLIDSYTAGRYADLERRERWNFTQYCTVNQIYVDGKLLVYDAVQLQDNSVTTVLQRMKQYNAVCMCVIVGDALRPLYTNIYNTVQAHHINYDSRRRILTGIDRDYIVCVSPLYLNKLQQQTVETMHGIVVRMVAVSTQLVNEQLRWMFAPIAKELVAPPWLR